MTPPKDRAPWELKPEEVQTQIAGKDQFEDCLSCRITGMATVKPFILLFNIATAS